MTFLYRALSTFLSCAVLFSGAYVRADDVSKVKSTTASSPVNVMKPESSVVVFLKKMMSELRLDAAQKTAVQHALEAFQQSDERSLVRRDVLMSEDQQTLTSVQRMQNTLARVDASAKDTKLAVEAYKKFYAVLDEPQKKYVDAAFYKLREKQVAVLRRQMEAEKALALPPDSPAARASNQINAAAKK